MNIAIIGGGIFGITCALKLTHENEVTIFEKNNDILQSASDVNQCRIHRGYHYPRSDKTAQEVIKAEKSFVDEFSSAVMEKTENYYCIAKNDSFVSGNEYIEFCNRNSLEYNEVHPEIVDKKSVQLSLKVNEKLFDHEKLKQDLWKKLKNSNIRIELNSEVTDEIFKKFDFVIICTYSNINSFLEKFPENVKKIALVNSTSKADSEERVQLRDRAIKMAQQNYESLVKMSVANLFSSASSSLLKKEITKCKKEALNTPLQGYIACTEGMKIRKETTDVLRKASCNKMIIAGKNDPILDYATVKNEAFETNSELITLNNGHMSHIEDYEELLSALRYFIKL